MKIILYRAEAALVIWLVAAVGSPMRTTDAQEAPSISVGFDANDYQIPPDQPFAINILLKPVPEEGLFSYGVVATFAEPKAIPDTVTSSVEEELDHHGVDGAGNLNDTSSTTIQLKGTADFFREPFKPLSKPEIARIRFPEGLPVGSYPLTLSPYITLGKTENLFVDGICKSLDERIEFEETVITVAPDKLNPLKLELQSGLFEQRVTVRNFTGVLQDALRVLIRDLPDDVRLWNAAGKTDEGIPYIIIEQVLRPMESTEVTLEYSIPNRKATPTPSFLVESVPSDTQEIEGEILTVDVRGRLIDGDVLLEFRGQKDARYHVQYSGDMVRWRTAFPAIEATGTSQQWIDNGPPKTSSAPSTGSMRYYRLVKP